MTDEFYDFLSRYLRTEWTCPDCGEREWTGYTDGHVWQWCLACPNLTRGWLGPAGYVTNYPVPQVPVPPDIEVVERFDMPPEIYLPHERRYYRKRLTRNDVILES